jgi:hypothetical protein
MRFQEMAGIVPELTHRWQTPYLFKTELPRDGNEHNLLPIVLVLILSTYY